MTNICLFLILIWFYIFFIRLISRIRISLLLIITILLIWYFYFDSFNWWIYYIFESFKWQFTAISLKIEYGNIKSEITTTTNINSRAIEFTKHRNGKISKSQNIKIQHKIQPVANHRHYRRHTPLFHTPLFTPYRVSMLLVCFTGKRTTPTWSHTVSTTRYTCTHLVHSLPSWLHLQCFHTV